MELQPYTLRTQPDTTVEVTKNTLDYVAKVERAIEKGGDLRELVTLAQGSPGLVQIIRVIRDVHDAKDIARDDQKYVLGLLYDALTLKYEDTQDMVLSRDTNPQNKVKLDALAQSINIQLRESGLL